MSEDRDALIASLEPADLEKLSDGQLKAVRDVLTRRQRERATKKLRELLADKAKEIAEALTTAPYVYLSPEVQVMTGVKVRFSTMMKSQLNDCYARFDEFLANENPTNMRSGDYLNSHFLAHTLTHYNGQEFGGVAFDPSEYQDLKRTSPENAQKVMESMRDQRLAALEDLSPIVHARLVEHYQAFQLVIEDMDDEVGESLGN